MKNILVITHKNCSDGCCSQAIFRTKFPNATYLELDHVNLDPTKDSKAHEYIDFIHGHKDSHIYVADFCLPYDMTDKLLQQGNRVTVLDHHESSVPHLEPFIRRIEEGENLNIEISFCHENIRSGTMLTWEHLYPDVEPPLSVKHISYGDTWKFELGDRTKHFYSGIMADFKDPDSAPKDFWIKLVTEEDSGKKFEEIGKPLYDKHMNLVEEISKGAIEVTLNGQHGLMVESTKMLTSELGNLLARKCGGFGLVYFVEDNGIVRCSLRSVAPLKVNDIAAKFGGGGHPQAAAFRCSNVEEFSQLLKSESKKVPKGNRI